MCVTTRANTPGALCRLYPNLRKSFSLIPQPSIYSGMNVSTGTTSRNIYLTGD
jgi:hypothetical protein